MGSAGQRRIAAATNPDLERGLLHRRRTFLPSHDAFGPFPTRAWLGNTDHRHRSLLPGGERRAESDLAHRQGEGDTGKLSQAIHASRFWQSTRLHESKPGNLFHRYHSLSKPERRTVFPYAPFLSYLLPQ